jgi:ornithine cyclodeaminase
MLVVNCDDIRRLVRLVGYGSFFAGLVECLREDFARWPRFQKSARLASHFPNGVLELMPTTDGRLYSFKYVNGHPQNPARGRLTVAAIGCLADVETGYPLLFSEMTLLTAFRTAATSAIAAALLARPESRVMALIGAGAQAEFQCLAFHVIGGIDQVRCFDTDSHASRKLIGNLQPFPDLEVEACASLEEAVRGADIITTATASKARQALLTLHNVPSGAHINAIGGDCPGKTELAPELLRQARVFVEYEPQTRIEGEMQNLEHAAEVHELWRAVAGTVAARTAHDQITIFDSVGFAVEDFSTLRYVHRLATTLGIGTELPLIPKVANPKNLFAALA